MKQSAYFIHLIGILILSMCIVIHSSLFPVNSESRHVTQLGDLWVFKVSPNEETGFNQRWFDSNFKKLGDYQEMPVPSSYNDIGMNASIRDHVGWVWYQKEFFAVQSWSRDHNRVFVRFGSVHYLSKIWLNGVFLGEHQGGHLPFEFEFTDHLIFKSSNYLTVAVNNRLNNSTLPQGQTFYPNSSLYPTGYSIYTHSCDYFDYAGINRPVYLFTTPQTYIKSVEFSAHVIESKGVLNFSVVASDSQTNCSVQLYDKQLLLIAESRGCEGILTVENVTPWWPIFSKHKNIAYLYTLEIQIGSKNNPDVYRESIGFRTLSWDSHGLYINGERIYIHGFGMHEDSNIRGRGFDYVILMRDLHLLEWVRANAIRTSHYPYAEETVAEAEKHGILVIVETPGCSIGSYGENLLQEHKRILKKMVATHKKKANVIMWSIANEPSNTTKPEAVLYFRTVAEYVKKLDPTRPSILITGEFAHSNASQSAFQYVDVIGVNRYASWYKDSGRLTIIQRQMEIEMFQWYRTFNKPVLITEYGAGSLSGLHVGPATMWSEDYQTEFHKQYFQAFDRILESDDNFFLGEMIWNLIDFKTPQEYIRPGLCVKGIFTRERQPKAVAYHVRQRYCMLANSLCSDDYQI